MEWHKDGAPIGDEGVVATEEHDLREVAHDGLGLQMEVAEHGVTTPATEELDDIAIDGAAEKGHGAGGPQRAGRD